MRSLSRLSMLVCVVAAMSFVALSPAQAEREKHEGSHHREAKHEKKEHAKHHMEKKGAQCENMEECAGKLDALIEELKSAQKAIDDGHTEDASEKLSAAVEQLEHFQKRMMKMSAEAAGKPVNTKCPIMGGEVDPDDTPAKLTRTFQGKTVGFCCAMCPGKWDKLSDEEKAAKLEKVTQ